MQLYILDENPQHTRTCSKCLFIFALCYSVIGQLALAGWGWFMFAQFGKYSEICGAAPGQPENLILAQCHESRRTDEAQCN